MSGKPSILSSIPGRIRIHLPHWSRRGQRRLKQRIRKLPGVRRVEANALTSNILIGFDPQTTNDKALLAALSTADAETNGREEDKPLPPVIHEGLSGSLYQAHCSPGYRPRSAHGGQSVASDVA